MITQTIKQWLNKLLAWWPWKQSPETHYAHTLNLHQAALQEKMWHTTADGPTPQSGVTSVAVEQAREDVSLDANRTTIEGQVERASQTHSPLADEKPTIPHPPLGEVAKDTATPSGESISSSLTDGQPLIFLRYLVKRGLVNEGFAEGQVPEQYRKF
jgi:hypothetical protein